MIEESKVSLFGFLFPCSILITFKGFEISYAYVLVPILLHCSIFLLVFRKYWQIIWRAYFIGCVFNVGLLIVLISTFFKSTGLYLMVLSVFHFGEYLATALFNPSAIKLEAFLLNHSLEYNVALLISLIEHAIILYFAPTLKSHIFSLYIGFLGCLAGDCFRKLAIYTAGKNFNHVVQYQKKSDHVLVTNGVYSLVRHPSYTGWFCWSIATQILLFNPICLIGYTIVSWNFFKDRIEYEELTLLHFFGDQYVEYQKKVPSGIPFVYGYKIESDFSNDKQIT